jgi:tetratricopeptide (TPR) repeat protein
MATKNRTHFYRLLALTLLFLGQAALLSSSSHARSSYSDTELKAAETSEESRIRELRNEEITQLRIALGRRSPANRRADLYLRLAEIYIETYRSEYLLEGRVHEQRLEKGQEDKLIDHSHSQPALNAGIKACKEILSFRIPYSKLDEVYYFLGFNYSELGDRAQGVKYFDQLTRQYPESSYVGEAYKEMGDAAFDSGNFRKSQAYYELAAKHGTPENLPRIDHKLAWSYYRTKQFDRAVETMKLAIANSQKNGEKFLSLREEALRDMAVFMTETGRVDEAVSYFQSVVSDKQFYPRVLEKLGRQYERNVEPVKATQVYESLLKTSPDSESGFRVLVKLVDLDLRRGRYREALGRLNGMKLPKGGENETQVAAQNLRAMIRRTATEHHEKFRKNGSRPDLEIAETYYASYLASFLASDDPRHEKPEIQMYLAEVKRELGKSKEASELYRQVVDSHDKRYAKEAGALWTASLSEAIRKTSKTSTTSATSAKGLDPSALELEYIDAADRLQDALGDSNDARESALRAAEVLAGYKNTQKDAIKRIQKIISRWPSSAQALTSARLWVQVEAEKSDEESLKDAMKELRDNQALMAADAVAGSKLKTLMGDQDTRLKIGVIATDEKHNDFAAAARNYEAFATEANGRELAEKAYANALSSYLKVGDVESVDRVSAAWIKRYPKSPRAIEATRNAATHYLVAGQFELTAKLFDRLGREAGDPESLETAARVYEGLGDHLHAQQLWTAYLAAQPKSPRRGAVAVLLGTSLEAAHLDTEASNTYRIPLNADDEYAPELGTRLADLYFRNQKPAEAKTLYRKVATTKARADSPFIGYARFRLAEMMEQETKFEPLEMPEAKLKKSLGQRLEFLEPLSRAYLSAVEAGGPWAISALDRLATWAMNFADEVDNIAPPQGADPAGVAQFKKNLESISHPLRKRAVTTWSEGYAKALSSETLSPALPEMSDRLADARAAKPSRAQGYRGKLRLAGIPADGGEVGKSGAFEKVREKLAKNSQDANAWVDYGNLLWGENRPLLGQLAYERALSLNPRNASALNNRGVALLTSDGQENWFNALRGQILFRDALRQDEFFLPALMNRAALFNYFRLFEKAKPLWDQILPKFSGAEAQDGLAIALQGMGQLPLAEAAFRKAHEAGASDSRFSNVYHEAARHSLGGGADRNEKCLDRLGDLDVTKLSGFEKSAVEHLKRTCTVWKSEAKAKSK